MQQAGRAADHGGQARYSEPREEDAIVVNRDAVLSILVTHVWHQPERVRCLCGWMPEFGAILADHQADLISRIEVESFETR